MHSYMSGSGKERKRQESLVWQSEGFAYAKTRGNKTRLSILFNVKDDLPSSEVPDDSYHLWRLKVEAQLPGYDFKRSYEIPVFKQTDTKAEISRRLHDLCVEHPEAESYREREIENILNIHQIPGGIELYYPAFKKIGGKLGALLIGAIFTGIGLAVGGQNGAIIFAVVFPLIGIPIAMWGLYRLLVSLRVRIDVNKIETIKKLLGVKIGGKKVLRSELKHLSLKKGHSSSANGEHTVYYKILAITLSGDSIVIGYNLMGRQVAEQALETFGLLTGIPTERL